MLDARRWHPARHRGRRWVGLAGEARAAPTRTLFPSTFASFIVFFASSAYDIIILRNLADKTIMFFMFGCGLALFSLAADVLSMIIRKIATDVRPGLHDAPRAAGRIVPERADVAARKKSAWPESCQCECDRPAARRTSCNTTVPRE